MTPEQRAAHDRQILADFDARFPVGTRVRYFVTLPFGPLRVTTIRSRAWRLDAGEFSRADAADRPRRAGLDGADSLTSGAPHGQELNLYDSHGSAH